MNTAKTTWAAFDPILGTPIWEWVGGARAAVEARKDARDYQRKHGGDMPRIMRRVNDGPWEMTDL